MNKLQQYIDIVGFDNLILLSLLALVGLPILALTPKRYNLSLSLMIYPPYMLLGLLDDLGSVKGIAKATGIFVPAWIAYAAFLHKSENKLPITAILGYITFFFLGLVVAINASFDPALDLIIHIQWGVTVLASLLVARLVYDTESAKKILWPLALGYGISLILLAIPILTGRGVVPGINRYFPWGANPNQCGTYMATMFSLGLLASLYAPKVWRPPSMVASGVALGLIILTKSRSVLFLALLPSLPLLFYYARKPLYCLLMVCAGVSGLALVSGDFNSISLERLTSLHASGRDSIAMMYLDKISNDPVFGMMFGGSLESMTHSHNVYLEVLYKGGIIYFLPLFVIVSCAIVGGARIAFRPKSWTFDPLFFRYIYAFTITVAIHGFANNNTYHATNSLAFVTTLFYVICHQGCKPQTLPNIRLERISKPS